MKVKTGISIALVAFIVSTAVFLRIRRKKPEGKQRIRDAPCQRL